MLASAYATQLSGYKLPQGPRIILPPPNTDTQSDILNLPRPSFFKKGNFTIEVLHHPPWSYPERHTAQQILPYIYLGPSIVSKDQDFFIKNGITLGLGIKSKTSRLLEPAIKRIEAMGVEASSVEFDDNAQLIKCFPTANQVIVDHIVKQHEAGKIAKVLVFCETGNEKSAAVVASFIMFAHRVDAVTAMQITQTRFCSAFDNNLRQQLTCYQDILDAQRSVGSVGENGEANETGPTAAALEAPVVKPSLKRGSEDMDVDMDDDGALLEEFAAKHQGQAPFDDDMFLNFEGAAA